MPLPKKSVQQILAEMQGTAVKKRYEDDEADSDALDLELEREILQARARSKMKVEPGDYGDSPPEDAIERLQIEDSQQELADNEPVYEENVSYQHHFPKNPPKDLIDRPIDLDDPRRYAIRERLEVTNSFQMTKDKVMAAALRAMGWSAEKISGVIGVPTAEIEEWYESPIFRKRVAEVTASAPEIMLDLLAAHAPTVGKKLLAIIMAGSKEHETQLKAIALYMKTIGADAKTRMRGKGDDRRVADAMQVLDAVEYRVLDGGLEPEEIFDTAWETARKDIGADVAAAIIASTPERHAATVKLLGYDVTGLAESDSTGLPAHERFKYTRYDPFAIRYDRPPPPSKVENLDDVVQLIDSLELDEWGDSQMTLSLTRPRKGPEMPESMRCITQQELLALRLEDEQNDDILYDYMRQKVRESEWMSILRLDPTIDDEIRVINRTNKREQRAWRKGLRLPTGRPPKLLLMR